MFIFRRKALIGMAAGTDSVTSVTNNTPATPESMTQIAPAMLAAPSKIRKELMSSESHRQTFHTAAMRRMPIWQMVALDKPTKLEEKRYVKKKHCAYKYIHV